MRIFVSHPYRSNPERNKQMADAICKYLSRKGFLPISPLHLFSYMQDDSRRQEILEVCKRLIDISDEVWVYGDSAGCLEEMRYAKRTGKPVRILFEPTDYRALMEEIPKNEVY